MDIKIFSEFRDFIYLKSGIHLTELKIPLLKARVSKRLRALEMDSYSEYLNYLKNDKSGQEIVDFLNVISTNTTHFYRESVHFDVLRKFIRKTLFDEGKRKLRIWSAASSSGEEPYSIAITVDDVMNDLGCAGKVDFKLLATDISTKVLEKALAGVYLKENMKELPDSLMKKYFTEYLQNKEAVCLVNDEIKQLISFRRLNLSQTPFPMKGPMDVIFCRNVMIYFDNEVRQKLIDEAYRLLKPGGLLMIGHSESLSALKTKFKILHPAVYIKHGAV